MSREDDERGETEHNAQFAPDWPFTEDPKPIPGVKEGADAWIEEAGPDPLAELNIDDGSGDA